jgi:hypothetical protein
MAAMLFGVAQLLNGDARAATEVLERAAHFGRKSQPVTAAFALAQLSLLAAEQGDWVTAALCGGEATELISNTGLGEYSTSVAVCVAEVRVALHRRDYQRARALAGKALRLYANPSPAAFPWLAAQIAIELGGILLDLGNYPGARLKVTEAQRQLARLPTGGVLRALHHRLAEDVAAHGARIRRVRRGDAHCRRTPHAASAAHAHDAQRDRRRAVHQPEHGQDSGLVHLRQAARVQPR